MSKENIVICNVAISNIWSTVEWSEIRSEIANPYFKCPWWMISHAFVVGKPVNLESTFTMNINTDSVNSNMNVLASSTLLCVNMLRLYLLNNLNIPTHSLLRTKSQQSRYALYNISQHQSGVIIEVICCFKINLQFVH